MQPVKSDMKGKWGALVWAARSLVIAYGARIAPGVPRMIRLDKDAQNLKHVQNPKNARRRKRSLASEITGNSWKSEKNAYFRRPRYIKTKYILYWLSFKANGHYNKHNIVFLLHRRNSNIASRKNGENHISGITNRSYMFRFLPFGTFHQQLDILTGTFALRVERHVLGPLLLDQGDTHCANQSINTWGRFHQRKGNQSELIKLTDWFAVL